MSSRKQSFEFRDVHAPGRLDGDEVHWQMASGHEAVDVCITTDALNALGSKGRRAHLRTFERHREFLCELARAKSIHRTRANQPVRIERQDLTRMA